MADIRVTDHPKRMDDDQTHTATPVSDTTIVDIVNGTNWLNIYNRPNVPSVRFPANSTGNTDEYSFVFPSTAPNASARELLVQVGVYYLPESNRTDVPQIRSSANTTWKDVSTSYSAAASAAKDHAQQNCRYTDIACTYYHGFLDISDGSPQELIEIDTSNCPGDLVYVSAWELPNNTADYTSTGGQTRNKCKIDADTLSITDPSDFYVGRDIEETSLESVYDSLNNSMYYNGQVLVHAAGFNYGNGLTGSTVANCPYVGIYIPPTATRHGQLDTGEPYTNCKFAIYGNSATSYCNVHITSENLASTSAAMTVTTGTTPVWWPWHSDDVATWNNTGGGQTCAVHSDGDWIFVQLRPDTEAEPEFTRLMIWVDNG